jgi:hypothetical protein
LYPAIQSRQQLIRYFDGYSEDRVEEIACRKLRHPLVKTHLLEVLDGTGVPMTETLPRSMEKQGIRMRQVDDGLFSVEETENGLDKVGFIEPLSQRVAALYSTHKTNDLVPWVRRMVSRSSELDHVWLSGITLNVLWTLVARLSHPQRFSRLAFTHDSIFDIDAQPEEPESDEQDEADDVTEPGTGPEGDVSSLIVERRATSFRLVDRVGVINEKLKKLQDVYSPLHAISQLRFPSPVGRGGHDFFDNGRVTNRSESFRDHRSHLLFVVRIYERLLKSTEEQTWYSIKESVSEPGKFHNLVGAPVVVRFGEPLTREVFDQWIHATFERKRNRFRLWGHPVRLGPTKVHVYGVDRHLWRPLFLELTATGCTAIIPRGTCGNTVHRLITNIQRYLAPSAQAFLGGRRYASVVAESALGVPYEPSAE